MGVKGAGVECGASEVGLKWARDRGLGKWEEIINSECHL